MLKSVALPQFRHLLTYKKTSNERAIHWLLFQERAVSSPMPASSGLACFSKAHNLSVLLVPWAEIAGTRFRLDSLLLKRPACVHSLS